MSSIGREESIRREISKLKCGYSLLLGNISAEDKLTVEAAASLDRELQLFPLPKNGIQIYRKV